MDINYLFKLAADKRASDIHLLFNQPPLFRVDGQLYDLNEFIPDQTWPVLSDFDLDNAAKTILNKDQFTRFLDKRDLDAGHQIGEYRYRVNFSFEKGHASVVARVITEEKPSLDDIGMPPIVKKLLDFPQGFVLVTGPTGCGKSTTLAAMINYVNGKRRANIITLEDPIEYVFKPEQSIISQRQLGTDMLSFASGLNHVLRQDPNVIMVGEMRDLETISTAVTLAETGHLVLATLHTYSAAQTIDRIIDIFPPHQQRQIKSQLASVMTAIISQRLLPMKTGGRVAAREILINNAAAANLIREGKIAQIKSVMETGVAAGMITLDKHIKQLYESGVLSAEVAKGQMEQPSLIGD